MNRRSMFRALAGAPFAMAGVAMAAASEPPAATTLELGISIDPEFSARLADLHENVKRLGTIIDIENGIARLIRPDGTPFELVTHGLGYVPLG